jgi:raffinose/stachyose/melibiose transport system permease protein
MNKYTRRSVIREAVMIVIALIFISPFYVLLNMAFGNASTQASPLKPTLHPTFSNFTQAWQQGNLGTALLTTIFVTAVSVALTVTLSAFAAYPLARVTALWSRTVFYLAMFGLILPFFIALIPLYQTMHALNLLGSPIALVILYTGYGFPLSVFLYTGFLRKLPRDYEEAAMIDGCNPIRTFRSVVWPLLRPVTGTVAILNAIFVWNDFLPPLLFLGTGKYETLPVAIYGFAGTYTSQWPLIFAGVTISILPLLIVFFAMQKRVMRGFSSGLKG